MFKVIGLEATRDPPLPAIGLEATRDPPLPTDEDYAKSQPEAQLFTQSETAHHITSMRTFDDTFSGEKIYPGKVC